MLSREMRRQDRQLGAEDACRIMQQGEYGILSTVDDDGHPYGVPLSFVYLDGAIYFHCATTGHKLDNLANNSRVAFCVVGPTRVLSAQFTTNYESAIVFGCAAEVEGDEKKQALLALLGKYSPDDLESGKIYIEKQTARTKVVKISIDRMTGKARK